MRAAQRGVRTQLVVDGWAPGALPVAWAERLEAAGVLYRVYSPLGRSACCCRTAGAALHRKLCVVDCRTLFLRRINVLDDFHDPNYGGLEAPRLTLPCRPRAAW